MNVLLQWKMPRACKCALVWLSTKFLIPCIVLGIVAAWVTNQTAMADLHRFAPEEAGHLEPAIYYIIAGFVPSLIGIFLVRLMFPFRYSLTSGGVREGGNIICSWQDMESYIFEASTAGRGICALKIKSRKRDRFYFLPFDPQVVDETQIVQILEEQMALHR